MNPNITAYGTIKSQLPIINHWVSIINGITCME